MSMYAPLVKTHVDGDGKKVWIPESHYFTADRIAEMISERAEGVDVDEAAIATLLENEYYDAVNEFVSQYTGWELMIDELPETAGCKMEEEIVKLAALVGIDIDLEF